MEIRFDTYYHYQELTDALRQLAAAHPALARLKISCASSRVRWRAIPRAVCHFADP